MKLFNRMPARKRLCKIYLELGYIPWRKPHKARKQHEGVYMGTREAIIPFLNNDAKRTISHLILRPGYLMRDYIQRRKHEQYLAPFTALLVFYSVFTLLTAVIQPGSARKTFGEGLKEGLDEITIEVDSMDVNGKDINTYKMRKGIEAVFKTFTEAILITHLDLYPEAVDTPWKESLAAVEGDIRSKGIPLFLGNFLMLWLAMAILLKKYKVSVSGAAAASAYVLCQFCIFMFLALLVTFGRSSDLGFLIMGILLFIDYRQWLQVGNRKALGLTIKTGLFYLGVTILFYSLLGAGLIAFALLRI